MSMSRSFTVYSLSLLLNELNTTGLNGRKVTINLATECQGLGGGNGDKMGGMETFALFLDRGAPPPPLLSFSVIQLMSRGNDTRQPIQLTRRRYEINVLIDLFMA